jgi:hypothetical protein
VKNWLSFVVVLLSTSVVAAGEPTVKLTVKIDTVDVTVGGKPFAVYEFSKDLPKPFFSPVRGPDGTILTRPIEKDGDDHPHHKGIWVAVDEINLIKFWAEKGKIVNKSVKAVKAEGNPARLRVVNQWMGEDGRPVLTENTLIRIYANGLLSYDIRFNANRQKVTFEDTKEGLFGFRMVDSMMEKEGGHVVNAEGLKGTPACWGKPSNWIDYYGKIDGKTYGVAIMDHPKNFRRSRYHVRNYGLFSISPFGEKAYSNGKNPSAPVHLAKGESLRLRYGMYIHPGDTDTAKVSEVYQQFVKGAK